MAGQKTFQARVIIKGRPRSGRKVEGVEGTQQYKGIKSANGKPINKDAK